MSAMYWVRSIDLRQRLSPLLLFFCLCLPGQAPLAHGSITADGDLCLLRIGFYTAHFSIFQPERSGHRDYCEDLPATGTSLFVMAYEHLALGDVPIEFRIIHDATGLGRFARLSDVKALGDLAPHTVFHRPPTEEPVVYTVQHTFDTAGDYLGIVTVPQPDGSQQYTAVFPFHVGARDWGLLPLFVLLGLLAHGIYRLSTGRTRWRRTPLHVSGKARLSCLTAVLLPALMLLPAPGQAAETNSWLSASGHYRASYRSEQEPPPLNHMHSWILRLEHADGTALVGATVSIEGGMPAHNHGLPTQPRVTEQAEPGVYRIDGLRFHMQGDWELRLAITHAGQRDTLVIPLRL